ncbi:gag-pol polyprotein [Lentinula edodes]|uniref:Gag-pol polyprotein n=1 Tax=Lentinula edodes TaxID=5353 RepID=A0A1Q3EJQ9_LENED|nr:gag-pol polyprotein [Lentinula edodes]
MAAHDSILKARVKQTRAANRKRRFDPFKEEDLVYVSTKNLTFEKGLARKLIPKYIGPFKITKDFGNHSFRVSLPNHFIQRGVHPVFHSSLLRIHVPNDDRRFPGRHDTQLHESPVAQPQWRIEKILSHTGSQRHAIFQLPCLPEYLELLGLQTIDQLPKGAGTVPEEVSIEMGITSIRFQVFDLCDGFENMKFSPSSSSYNLDSLSNPFPPSVYQHSLPASPHISHSSLPILPHPIMAPLEFQHIERQSHSKFALVAKNDDGDKIVFSAQQVRLYVYFDKNLRRMQKHIGYTPIGYHSFASEFNKEDLPYKFAYWDHASFHEPTITNLNTQSPPMSIFGIEEWECFAPNKAVRPGYEEVLSTEYRELCSMALEQARGATRGRRKAEVRKQEKKNAAAAAEHKKTGTLHFHSGPKNAGSSSRS